MSIAAAISPTSRWRALSYSSRSLLGSGRTRLSACKPRSTSTVPNRPPPVIRSAFSRWRTFQSSCGSAEGAASSSNIRSIAATSATLRRPMPITLALGTMTVAPSSSRERVTTSQFWPAMFFTETPVILQMPWFG